VALLARDDRMPPKQREAGQIVIERHLQAPGILIVALLAVGPELTFVRVVLFVARDTGHCELIAVKIAFVAAVAADARVLAAQRELGLPRMIEPDRFPFLGLVAGVAFCSVPAMVNILKLMACGASGWYTFVFLVCMAR
jgi:hypothetical protein